MDFAYASKEDGTALYVCQDGETVWEGVMDPPWSFPSGWTKVSCETEKEEIAMISTRGTALENVSIEEYNIIIRLRDKARGDVVATNNAMNDVRTELIRATALHGPMRSTHEGYAVLKEEVDELWDGVKANDAPAVLRGEAVQVAAMAIRFILDVCKK